MNTSLFFLVALSLSLYTYAQTPCFANISVEARSDPYATWTIASTTYQIWDITVTNAGSCVLTDIVAFYSARGGSITEAWNYDIPSGRLSGFGGALPIGWTFKSAGFVLANSTGPTMALSRPSCDASTCTAATTTSAPSGTTSAPSVTTTQAPSVTTTHAPASTTTAPVTTPSSSGSTTAPATGCAITAVVTRDGYSWMDSEGRNNSVYHLTITNAGPCALKDYATSFAYYPGTLVSSWNLEGTRGGYFVKGYGDKLAAGSSYSGAGMILADAPEQVAVTPYGSNCAC